ncbi:hypothetical protein CAUPRSCDRAFT_10813 [Caulochytrium protostelioides]|nr:hypothetical protein CAUPRSCDRAFT_10813 [Caulochytrium protostelioides]
MWGSAANGARHGARNAGRSGFRQTSASANAQSRSGAYRRGFAGMAHVPLTHRGSPRFASYGASTAAASATFSTPLAAGVARAAARHFRQQAGMPAAAVLASPMTLVNGHAAATCGLFTPGLLAPSPAATSVAIARMASTLSRVQANANPETDVTSASTTAETLPERTKGAGTRGADPATIVPDETGTEEGQHSTNSVKKHRHDASSSSSSSSSPFSAARHRGGSSLSSRLPGPRVSMVQLSQMAELFIQKFGPPSAPVTATASDAAAADAALADADAAAAADVMDVMDAMDADRSTKHASKQSQVLQAMRWEHAYLNEFYRACTELPLDQVAALLRRMAEQNLAPGAVADVDPWLLTLLCRVGLSAQRRQVALRDQHAFNQVAFAHSPVLTVLTERFERSTAQQAVDFGDLVAAMARRIFDAPHRRAPDRHMLSYVAEYLASLPAHVADLETLLATLAARGIPPFASFYAPLILAKATSGTPTALQDAEDVFDQARQCRLDGPRIYLSLAETYAHAGDYDSACDVFERLAPHDQVVLSRADWVVLVKAIYAHGGAAAWPRIVQIYNMVAAMPNLQDSRSAGRSAATPSDAGSAAAAATTAATTTTDAAAATTDAAQPVSSSSSLPSPPPSWARLFDLMMLRLAFMQDDKDVMTRMIKTVRAYVELMPPSPERLPLMTALAIAEMRVGGVRPAVLNATLAEAFRARNTKVALLERGVRHHLGQLHLASAAMLLRTGLTSITEAQAASLEDAEVDVLVALFSNLYAQLRSNPGARLTPSGQHDVASILFPAREALLLVLKAAGRDTTAMKTEAAEHSALLWNYVWLTHKSTNHRSLVKDVTTIVGGFVAAVDPTRDPTAVMKFMTVLAFLQAAPHHRRNLNCYAQISHWIAKAEAYFSACSADWASPDDALLRKHLTLIVSQWADFRNATTPQARQPWAFQHIHHDVLHQQSGQLVQLLPHRRADAIHKLGVFLTNGVLPTLPAVVACCTHLWTDPIWRTLVQDLFERTLLEKPHYTPHLVAAVAAAYFPEDPAAAYPSAADFAGPDARPDEKAPPPVLRILTPAERDDVLAVLKRYRTMATQFKQSPGPLKLPDHVLGGLLMNYVAPGPDAMPAADAVADACALVTSVPVTSLPRAAAVVYDALASQRSVEEAAAWIVRVDRLYAAVAAASPLLSPAPPERSLMVVIDAYAQHAAHLDANQRKRAAALTEIGLDLLHHSSNRLATSVSSTALLHTLIELPCAFAEQRPATQSVTAEQALLRFLPHIAAIRLKKRMPLVAGLMRVKRAQGIATAAAMAEAMAPLMAKIDLSRDDPVAVQAQLDLYASDPAGKAALAAVVLPH